MTVFYLIRHAESDYNLNLSHLIGGRSNHSPLSATGEVQAAKLAYRFQKEGVTFDRWMASPAVRTQRTAEIVRDILNPKAVIETDDRLQELHQGEWEGKERKLTYTPEVLVTINSDNWNFKAPQGESQREVEERMAAFLVTSLEDVAANTTIAVFTHGVAIKCLIRNILGSAPPMTVKMAIENTSLTVLRHDNKAWYLDRLNDHAHLTI